MFLSEGPKVIDALVKDWRPLGVFKRESDGFSEGLSVLSEDLKVRWPGVAGASGAVASTAAVWLRHVTTWSTTRRPGLPRLGKTLRDVDFRWLPLLKGHGSTPSLQLLNVGHRQQAVFLFARPLLNSIRFPRSPRTRPLLAAYAFAVLYTVAFGNFRCYIAFPHTAAFGTVRLFFRSLLAHSFADFSHTIACGSFRLFGSLAHPSAGFSQTIAYGSFRLFAVLHTVAFGSTCLFAVFLHKVAFDSVCSAVLPYSRSWQLALRSSPAHDHSSAALALRHHPAHGRPDSSRSSQSSYTRSLSATFALRNPRAHGRFGSTHFLQSS